MAPRSAVPAALILTAALATTAAAEPPPPRSAYSVRPGERVRLWASDLGGQPLVGSVATVNATDHAALVVVVDAQATVVPFASIQRLDVSRGSELVVPATIVGGLLGLALGAILRAEDVIDSDLSDLERGAIMAGTAALGALGGHAVGRSIPEYRWQPVDLGSVRRQPAAFLGPQASFTLRF